MDGVGSTNDEVGVLFDVDEGLGSSNVDDGSGRRSAA